ncbi:kinase-like domain-containing protein [Whalleya microplaca]|nr:kinase-like domain-containing protein [Whalleya microplaca]
MSSTRSPVFSPTVEDMDEDNLEDFIGNVLILEMAPFGLGKLFDYEHGGHHPVHLGDVINEHYRIIHKLGNGAALKLLMAEASTLDYSELHLSELRNAMSPSNCDGAAHISLPLDQFNMQGPNGSHLCFVYPMFGPSIALGLFDSEDPDGVLKGICLKVVKALGFLHQHGICHGDFTSVHILHKEVIRALGQPVLNRVLQGETNNEITVPQYLVYPVPWCDLENRHISPEPCLINSGESFKISDPPEDLGIPGPYRSPEVVLEKTVGIRTGRKIFRPFDDDDNDYLDTMVQVLGPLPEPWWSTTWQKRKAIYWDMPERLGRAVAVMDEASWEDKLTGTVHPSVAEGARSLQEKLAPGFWYMPKESRGIIHRAYLPPRLICLQAS